MPELLVQVMRNVTHARKWNGALRNNWRLPVTESASEHVRPALVVVNRGASVCAVVGMAGAGGNWRRTGVYTAGE